MKTPAKESDKFVHPRRKERMFLSRQSRDGSRFDVFIASGKVSWHVVIQGSKEIKRAGWHFRTASRTVERSLAQSLQQDSICFALCRLALSLKRSRPTSCWPEYFVLTAFRSNASRVGVNFSFISQEVHQQPTRIPGDGGRHFSSKRTTSNFFLGESECFHAKVNRLILGVKWWTRVSSPITIRGRHLSPSTAQLCRKLGRPYR
jgi:hypothetical protein